MSSNNPIDDLKWVSSRALGPDNFRLGDRKAFDNAFQTHPYIVKIPRKKSGFATTWCRETGCDFKTSSIHLEDNPKHYFFKDPTQAIIFKLIFGGQ